MNRMLGYLKGYERESVLAPLFKMLEATFDLFVPLVMADIVNVGIAAHDLHYILVRCGLLLLLAFIGGMFIEKSKGNPPRRRWAIPPHCGTPCLPISRA